MQNNITLATKCRLYSRLDEAADEIRVVSIGLCLPGYPLRCTLEKVSLKDFKPEYGSFMHSTSTYVQTPRQVKERWVGAARPDPQPKGVDLSCGSTPAPHRHRFNWGDFAALSYVWGDESIRKDIILSGETVSVTANLESALRALAGDNTFGDRFRLWIDAICINQADDHERAHQVQKMRDIYSGAWFVIAWIGWSRPDADINHAFRFLRILASLQGDQRDLERLQIEEGEPSKGIYFCALNGLMKQEYWSRLWVIQELIMGASSTILRQGNQVIDWSTFCNGIGVLYHGSNWTLKDRELRKELTSRGFRDNLVWQTYSIHLVHIDLRPLSRFDGEGTNRIGFRRLLDIANSADCRDVRDKVFALIGMMDPAIAADIMIAYEFEPPKLFAAVARVFIAHTKKLEPLRHGNPWGPVGAPSWAADWTWDGRVRFSRPEYNLVAPPWEPSDPEPDPDAIYCAHGSVQASYTFLDDWRLFSCEGFIFDEVVGLGAPEAGYFTWHKHRIAPCPSWRSSYGDFEATGSALWHTLLLSVVAKGERVQQRHAALLSLPSMFWAALPQFQAKGWDWLMAQGGYYFKWEGWRSTHDSFMLGEEPLGSYFSNAIPQDAEELTYMEVYCSCQRAVQQRRFMLTRNGYFGWGPDNLYETDQTKEMKVGDKIAIIFGCSTPLVIRPVGDKFMVVGEAYVQGFMDGEALALTESGTCDIQSFIFC
ncbi:MAG: hypothetical protein CL912_30980 [Deltaproteobacteria bacterium]|nr:hypothetical protein [Deltaproteobacteria bacterium]